MSAFYGCYGMRYYVDNATLMYDGTNWLDQAWNVVNPNFYGLYPTNPVSGAVLTIPPYQAETNINGDSIYYCSNLKDSNGKDILYYIQVDKRAELNDNGKIDFKNRWP